MTVKSLSLASSVPSKTLYHWMAGQNPRSIESLYRVALVLGVTLEELAFAKEDGIGAWLKVCRERVRMTITEAAGKVGLSWQDLQAIEEGQSEADKMTAVLLGINYQIPLEVLTAKLRGLKKTQIS